MRWSGRIARHSTGIVSQPDSAIIRSGVSLCTSRIASSSSSNRATSTMSLSAAASSIANEAVASTSHRGDGEVHSVKARFRPWPVEAGMGWNGVLAHYASVQDPLRDIPGGSCYSADAKTMTLYDGYEKAKYHLLVLPRHPFPLAAADATDGSSLSKASLDSISALRQSPHALAVLQALKDQSVQLVRTIEQEMMRDYGWKWPVHVGFHSAESMKHVHLHVISSDLISPALKNKKHYNSFHPKLSFFLHLDDVITDVEEARSTDPRTVHAMEAILKQPLVSIYDEEEYKTMPKLKDHLEKEWKERGREAVKQMERKRKTDEVGDGGEAKERKLA